MWHCLGVLTYVDPSNVLRLQLGQFRPIGTYYTVAPVQMAEMRAESGGHVVAVGRRLHRRHEAEAASSPQGGGYVIAAGRRLCRRRRGGRGSPEGQSGRVFLYCVCVHSRDWS